MSDRFYSPAYYNKAHVLGIDVATDSQGPLDIDADTKFKVFDEDDGGPKPVFIHVQNLGTEPIRYSEGISDCDASTFSGIIAAGSGTDLGDGGGIEYSRMRPTKLYLHADNAYRVCIIKRYADDN